MDKKDDERKTKLKEAKEKIPAKIEAGKKEIEKSEIEAIFDKITSASGTGGGLPFEIKSNSEATPKATTETESNAESGGQTKWHNGIRPETRRKQAETYLRQAETDRKQDEK